MAMKKIDLLQGTLDLLILKTLSAGPLHGYRIAQKIQQLSDEVLPLDLPPPEGPTSASGRAERPERLRRIAAETCSMMQPGRRSTGL